MSNESQQAQDVADQLVVGTVGVIELAAVVAAKWPRAVTLLVALGCAVAGVQHLIRDNEREIFAEKVSGARRQRPDRGAKR